LHVIDQFHQEGHTKCSEAFFLSLFKKYPGPFKYMADSAAETGNSQLRSIEKMARYMRQENLMDLVRLKLEIQNRIRIRKLSLDMRQATTTPEFDPIAELEKICERKFV
jgi:hypothetical protein